MSRRWRWRRYGASVAVALVGVACGAVLPGSLGGTLATALIGIGLVGVISLVFYEIGLSEDRDRDRDRRLAEPPGGKPTARSGGGPDSDRAARPRRLERRRGERRRLR